MSTKYKATIPDEAYFVTITTVGWIDVFTRLNQKQLIIKALKFCQEYKGLDIFAYCLMPSHLHMLCAAPEGKKLSDIIRDLKKFTSKEIIRTIIEYPESRRECLPAGQAGMLSYFKQACEHLKRTQQYKVWQNGYHAEIAYSNKFIKEKIDYIHMNPVKDKIVTKPEDYYFSSARNYADLDNDLNVQICYFFDV